MSDPDASAPEEVMWAGRFITAKRRGKWEYVGRARGIRAAVILAIDDGHVLLVDQYRVPLGRRCIELPAGLVGDHDADEDAGIAASRELEEETGYRAARLESVGEFFSSPGMVSESFTLFRAHDLEKTGEGWKIYDLNVLGIWLAETYRSQFAQEINNKGIDGLIATMSQRNKAAATAKAG